MRVNNIFPVPGFLCGVGCGISRMGQSSEVKCLWKTHLGGTGPSSVQSGKPEPNR